MATLFRTEVGEVGLTLSGTAEDTILTTLRHWPHWTRAEVERDKQDPSRCLSVTLVTDQAQEENLRHILDRSFGLRFPETGGTVTYDPPPVASTRKRKW